MPGEFFERLRWLGRLFLVLFVLGAAAFLSAITAMRFAILGRVVAMPDVVGKSYVVAERDMRSRQLGVRVADHAYSGLPVDNVVRQSPPPGTQVKVGQLAQVVLSLGPQKVTVPSLIGGITGALATGILYFTFAITGSMMSIGLAILIIGIPFFLLFIGTARLLALAEGRIVESLLGTRMPRRPVFGMRAGANDSSIRTPGGEA